MGERSGPFQIKTWVRKDAHERNQNGHKKHQGITIDYLAFADDLGLLPETIKGAKEHIASLQEQTAKVELQISFEKTNFITNIEPSSKHLIVGENKIMRVEKFKYIRESSIHLKTQQDGTGLSTN